MTTPEGALNAVAALGFTARQAGFLVLVLRHAGVCLDRQYCAYAGIVHGAPTRNLFRDLVDRGFATAYPCRHNRAWIYHVHQKALYRAIGEPNSRYRRPMFLGRAVERLMLLDAVLLDSGLEWLATEREKLAHFTVQLQGRLDRHALPSLTFGNGTATTIRYFPDRLPIGASKNADDHVFVYLITRSVPVDFRAFLHRHAELFRALRRWRVRLLVPRHLWKVAPVYQLAFAQELATPLGTSVVGELRWYFRQRRAQASARPDGRYQRGERAFAAPRFGALYRAWLQRGDSVLDAAASPVLADAIRRHTGRLECTVLPYAYHHLLPLVGTA